MPLVLSPEPHKEIESYEKGFKPYDHVIGETPEELINKHPGTADCLKFHIHEYGGKFLEFKCHDKEQVNDEEQYNGFRISPRSFPNEQEEG